MLIHLNYRGTGLILAIYFKDLATVKLITDQIGCRFGSLLACETFHADVHAGNLWLLRDGRIGFLDFGL